jgi:cyclophilin family peptidyl-prolyl cis-trans isomerase
MHRVIRIITLLALLTGPAWAQEDTGKGNPQVTLHTSKGNIRLELYAEQAPITVENFLQYARDGFYDGTVFHRVISHFMIQGGGFTADMKRKPTRDPIANEATNGLKNLRGTIAMARTTDPQSATAQFFINVELNPNLDHVGTDNSRDWGYAVFGHVTEGMDVVDDIRFVRTAANDRPLETVLIESVEIH